MKKYTKLFSLLGIFILSITLTSNLIKPQALPISPDKYFLTFQSDNQVINNKLMIYGRENLEEVQTAYIYTLGMKKIGEEHDREFYQVDPNDKSEIANWIELSQSEIQIKKGDVIEIPWKITNNGQGVCGTNLAAIVVASAPRDNQVNGSKVAIKNEVISQVHVDITQINGVECPIKPDLGLVEFKINHKYNVFDAQNVPFITRIQTKNNVIAKQPKGFIEIYQGSNKIDTLDFNPQGLDIYPNTIRKFDNLWLHPDYPINGNFFEKLWFEITHFQFGKFEAKLGITKNVSPQIVSSVSFWIIPWRILLVILIIIILIIIYVTYKKRDKDKIKSKNTIR